LAEIEHWAAWGNSVPSTTSAGFDCGIMPWEYLTFAVQLFNRLPVTTLMLITLGLIAALLVIVLAAEVFTNALEHLGERLKISEGVTGSVFAAVATALPETTVPLLAIFAGTHDQQLNEEIGVGAILGAPLMLSTLAMGLLAGFTVAPRGLGGGFQPEPSGITRDLDFFCLAFLVAALALFVPLRLNVFRALFAALLVLGYFVYVLLTVRASAKLVDNGHGTQAHEPMLLSRFGLPESMTSIVVQLLVGLVLLLGGAKAFIHGVEQASAMLGVSALLLSLLVIPVATELPEKINSILWIRRRKDTLAFGNITGAMVFQGTLLPAIGMMLTPWEPRREVLGGVAVTLSAAFWLRSRIRAGTLRVWHLAVNGLLYGAYLGLTLL
jgi:cation:H+ antiporter